jgi:hypothetical protein
MLHYDPKGVDNPHDQARLSWTEPFEGMHRFGWFPCLGPVAVRRPVGLLIPPGRVFHALCLRNTALIRDTNRRGSRGLRM